MAYTSEKDTEMDFVKILIMGLDNSGKSSILLSLTKTTNLLSYFSLKPTKGINIVKIEDQNTSFHIWDFGGQEQYRQQYLLDFGKYSEVVDKIIFVIDVQDIHRYDAALKYLEDILHLVIDKTELQLSIFLHKFDPYIEALENYSEEKINTRLVNKINEIIADNFNFKIFKTTIYTVFQKSLLQEKLRRKEVI